MIKTKIDNIQWFNEMCLYKDNRILIVDDEEFCISAIQSMLNELGINVNT